MIAKQSVRDLYESMGPAKFVRHLYHQFGLSDLSGRRHRDEAGNPTLKNPKDSTGAELPRLRTEGVSIKDLAESIIGENWYDKFNPDTTRRVMLEESGRSLLEAGTGPIVATDFIDINAWTIAVTGLLEVTLLEAWQNPEYISDELMPPEPTRTFGGKKVIGTGRVGDVAEPRKPGMPTKRVQFGERWIQTPETLENALSIEVTQEAIYLDLTGEISRQANEIGDWLRWRKEIRCIDAFIGVTNTYSYNGTSYNTYLSNGFYNNSLTGQELLHWTQWQQVLLTFRDMLDPTTNTRVLIKPNTILVNLEKLATANAIFGADTRVQYRDAPGSTTNPQNIRDFRNPYAGEVKILTSPLVYQRCTDASGLNLSASNAGKYWWAFESGKQGPFRYMQNWPLRFQTASPNNIDMVDRGIVAFYKADERGVPAVFEPRKIVQNAP